VSFAALVDRGCAKKFAVNDAALTLALRLLTAAAATVALGTMEACLNCPDSGWQAAEIIELGIDADLLAVVTLTDRIDDRHYDYLAVGAAGTVVAWGRIKGYHRDTFVESTVAADVDLRAAWASHLGDPVNRWVVVGDAGTAVVSRDGGQTWMPDDLGTDADLHAITDIDNRLIVVGDEVVRVQNIDGTWSEPPTPAGGWGRLRGLYHQTDSMPPRIWVVGLEGVIWSAEDPSGPWVAGTSGVTQDLFAIGQYYDRLVAVGAGGTILIRDASGWTRVEISEQVDFVDYVADGFPPAMLAADGRLFELEDDGKSIEQIDTFVAGRGLTADTEYVVVVGDGGTAARKIETYCEGRPFVVDGRSQTASLRGAPSSALAHAWASDGLDEHASVASFARFALELLALGAPPRLLREVQAAIADELRHAELCFELAHRDGGAAVGPGPLRVGAHTLARVGDPVATALALFEEGCLNESVAACEAADAAGACQDPAARHVLEILAADERRHATIAWGALRWLIDSYGERVSEPLRARLGRLNRERPGAARDQHELDSRLAAHGRTSRVRQAEVRRRVIDELVGPLAYAMVGTAAPRPKQA
jgi:hypothetical protein